jgi:hypothetical protein
MEGGRRHLRVRIARPPVEPEQLRGPVPRAVSGLEGARGGRISVLANYGAAVRLAPSQSLR